MSSKYSLKIPKTEEKSQFSNFSWDQTPIIPISSIYFTLGWNHPFCRLTICQYNSLTSKIIDYPNMLHHYSKISTLSKKIFYFSKVRHIKECWVFVINIESLEGTSSYLTSFWLTRPYQTSRVTFIWFSSVYRYLISSLTDN